MLTKEWQLSIAGTWWEYPVTTGKALLATHRVKATLGYNIAYFLTAVALLSTESAVTLRDWGTLGILFAAVFLLKTQASLADVLHDYDVDRANPEKSVLAESVDHLGRRTVWALLILELLVSVVLWSVLAVSTREFVFVVIGVGGIVLGFTYSYPPRIKERGVWNHVVTSGVDVVTVLFPAEFLLDKGVGLHAVPVLLIVFVYSLAYHILHQAADTYYDRQAGVSTFTQDIGIETSVILANALFLLAGAATIYYSLPIATFALLLAALRCSYIMYRMANRGEQAQTDIVAAQFNIATWATALNTAVAVSVYLAHYAPWFARW